MRVLGSHGLPEINICNAPSVWLDLFQGYLKNEKCQMQSLTYNDMSCKIWCLRCFNITVSSCKKLFPDLNPMNNINSNGNYNKGLLAQHHWLISPVFLLLHATKFLEPGPKSCGKPPQRSGSCFSIILMPMVWH